ncbi:MAG: hypothetical protein EXR71_01190 [Myxococcales bacterium]|nr:hypothetical protein [Myxococcales bacterium]
MSRVTTHKLTDDSSVSDGSLLGNLQRIGFRKVTFSDTYNESWTYTLTPPDESHGGRAVLEPMGLGAPLVLAD